MKFCIILQARLGSKRFPGKIIKKITNDHNSLSFLISKIKQSKNNLIVATTKKPIDNEIVKICKKNNVFFFRGSENNVYERYRKASKKFKIKNIIRLTSDCPLLDLKLLNRIKKTFIKYDLDYISNTLPIEKSKFPNGSDIEIFKSNLFKKYKNLSAQDKEHVTNLFWKDRSLKTKIISSKINYSNFRYTLDYKRDLTVIKKILKYFSKNKQEISYKNICKFLIKNPKISTLNKNSNKVFQGNNIK